MPPRARDRRQRPGAVRVPARAGTRVPPPARHIRRRRRRRRGRRTRLRHGRRQRGPQLPQSAVHANVPARIPGDLHISFE